MIITRDIGEFSKKNRRDCIKLLTYKYGRLNDDVLNDILSIFYMRLTRDNILTSWNPLLGGYSEYVSKSLYWSAGDYFRDEQVQRGTNTVSLETVDYKATQDASLGYVLSDYISWLKKHGAEHTSKLLTDMKEHFTSKNVRGFSYNTMWWKFTEAYIAGAAGVTGSLHI